MPSRRQILAASLALAGTAGAAAPALAQTKSLPGSLAARFAATLSAHDIDKFADLFADSYVNHQMSAAAPPPAAGMTPKQGTVGYFKARLTGIPDLKVTIEALVVGRDRVAASFVYTGTHGGVYFGIAPTGKKLRFTSCDIFRVKNGRFVEHWGMGDTAGILAQLKT